eukprot:symbB.v1.2.004552.t1/scaffold245.1/size253980/9
MLSALACSLEFLVRRYQKIFPHRLFELLKPLEFNQQSVFNLPACLRDPLTQHFFESYTHEAAFEAKAQAYLSAMAQMIELDIADVESKHSSIRELTMLRSRGHQISLQELSARDLFHFVGKKYDVKFQEYESGQGQGHQHQQPESGQIIDGQGTKRKYTATVGGAWRAFLRARAAGEPLTPERIKNLASEYRSLSHDEHQHFKDMGFAAVARHELALASASSRKGAPTDNSSAVVAASLQEVSTMLSSPSWDMCDYDSFCRAVCDVASAKRQLAKAQAQKAFENQASLESQADRTWQTELHKHGSALVKHICQKPAIMNIPRLGYKEGHLHRSMLEKQWQSDHATIRHEAQQKLEYPAKGDSKTCYKLGVCLCNRTDVKLFCKKLFMRLKKSFPSAKKDKNKVKSMERCLYEGGYVVLHFHSPCAANMVPDRELFLQAGHTNFKTWEFACFRLHRVLDQTVGSDTVLLSVGSTDDFEDCLDEVCAIFAAVKSWLDLSLSWSLQVFEMLADEEAVEFTLMQPRFVEISQTSTMPHFSIELWKGWELEKPRRKSRRLSQDQDSDLIPARSAPARPNRNRPPGPKPPNPANDDANDALVFDEDPLRNEDDIQNWFNELVQQTESQSDDHEDDDEDNGQWNVQDALASLLNDDADDPENEPQQLPVPANPVQHLFDEEESEEELQPFNPRRPRVAAPGQLGVERQPKQAEEIFEVPGYGNIRYNQRGFLRAHCSQAGHGKLCRRQRQTLAGKHPSMGRPIGSLISWLKSSHNHEDDAGHKLAATRGFDERLASREWFEALPGGRDFAERHERPLKNGESREPRIVWN